VDILAALTHSSSSLNATVSSDNLLTPPPIRLGASEGHPLIEFRTANGVDETGLERRLICVITEQACSHHFLAARRLRKFDANVKTERGHAELAGRSARACLSRRGKSKRRSRTQIFRSHEDYRGTCRVQGPRLLRRESKRLGEDRYALVLGEAKLPTRSYFHSTYTGRASVSTMGTYGCPYDVRGVKGGTIVLSERRELLPRSFCYVAHSSPEALVLLVKRQAGGATTSATPRTRSSFTSRMMGRSRPPGGARSDVVTIVAVAGATTPPTTLVDNQWPRVRDLTQNCNKQKPLHRLASTVVGFA